MEANNNAKLREACLCVRQEIESYCTDGQNLLHRMLEDPPEYKELRNTILDIHEKICAALAAPDRNCDVGDAVEQTERFRRYCDKYLLDRDEGECVGCPLVNMAGYCEFNWSQLPYESEVVK